MNGGTDARWIGPLFAIVGTLGFSFKAILIKLAYAWHPIDATTLLALRMLYAAPFFIAMAWWAGARRRPDPATGRTAPRRTRLHRLLPREPARLRGPHVHQRGARAARALPLPDDGRPAVGAGAAQADRAASAGRAGALLRGHRAGVLARPARDRRHARDRNRRRAGVRKRAAATRSTWSGPAASSGGSARCGSSPGRCSRRRCSSSRSSC